MAPQIPRINERGSLALESIPVTLLLLTFVTGLLLAGYFIFARAWVHYQGERGLFCAAQARSTDACERELRSRIARVMPFGELERVRFSTGREEWTLEIIWNFNDHRLHLQKRLRVREAATNRALRW